jgi:hypothetical protein
MIDELDNVRCRGQRRCMLLKNLRHPLTPNRMKLGNVVKSNSHCDYIVQLDDALDVNDPPCPDKFGFGSFVKLETSERHWAVGLVYSSQLFNPNFLNRGPQFFSELTPVFTPDLIRETCTLLMVVLIGSLVEQEVSTYGCHGVPSVVVPVNAVASCMTEDEIFSFHRSPDQETQFCYYAHMRTTSGSFATDLLSQVLAQVTPLFEGNEQKALGILSREVAWKSMVGVLR